MKEGLTIKIEKESKPKEVYRNKKKKRFIDENKIDKEDASDIMDSFDFPGWFKISKI